MNTTRTGGLAAYDAESLAAPDTTDRDSSRVEKRTQSATLLAEQLCLGFKAHDERKRTACVEAFFEVDRHQFPHLDEAAARRAATAFTDALWAKDDVEAPHVEGQRLVDADGLDAADWRPVREALARRASIVGIDVAYAEETTRAWRRHKTGGDYWTPTLRAQRRELQAAFQDDSYAEKTEFGGSGFGSLAARYLVAVECHDAHTEDQWERAVDVMTPYFADVLEAQESGR